MGKFINISGQRFGFWVVLEKIEKNKSGQIQWLCQCECGNKKAVTTNSLRTGNSTSCGCNHKPDLVGQKFGNLTVQSLNTSNKGRRHWNCVCVCGNFVVASTYQLRNNIISSCGCLSNKIIVIDQDAELNPISDIKDYHHSINAYQGNIDIMMERMIMFKKQQEIMSKNINKFKNNLGHQKNMQNDVFAN